MSSLFPEIVSEVHHLVHQELKFLLTHHQSHFNHTDTGYIPFSGLKETPCCECGSRKVPQHRPIQPSLSLNSSLPPSKEATAEKVQRFLNVSQTDEVLMLNVGGEPFTTLRSTLSKHPDSMLAAMFSGRYPIITDPEGRAFLDRDPFYFRLILGWLRSDVVPSIPDEHKQGFAAELDFFALLDRFPENLKAFTLLIGEPYTNPRLAAENTIESLSDGDFRTGVCADKYDPTITAVFPSAVLISGVSVAAYFKDATFWATTAGADAVIECLDGDTWKLMGRIPSDFGQNQKVHMVTWEPLRSARWRIRNKTWLGLSHLVFH